MAEKLKAADVVQKDTIVSNLCLSLYFDQQKMTHYSLKEPFASLVELNAFQLGGAEDKSFERLLTGIAEYFINNPAPAWSRQLREARNSQLSEVYAY